MKKSLCIILSLILVLSSAAFNATAARQPEVPFAFEVHPEKQVYAKGEEIKLSVSLENQSLDKMTDMRVWVDYPLSGCYLTPGVTERFVETLDGREDMSFRIIEDEGVLGFASKFEGTTLIKGFLLRLAHFYKSLTLAYATVRYAFQNMFISVGQQKLDLGTAKVIYDGTEIEFNVKCRYSVKKTAANEARKLADGRGAVQADIKAAENSFTGLTFAMSDDGSEFGLFVINPDLPGARIYSVKDGKYNLLGAKNADITAAGFYKMRAVFDGSRVLCYVYDNPKDADPYPVFDFYYASSDTGCGVFCGSGEYSGFTLSDAEITACDKTYTNPVYDNAPDPYILKQGGTYYLYATTDAGSGYRVSFSTDLVNWSSLGFCARKGDIFGDGDFWAPEVYEYRGRYYMLYSTDEHLALASADSPTGPFVKTKNGYLLEDKCIDGHLLFDDDGSIYLYMAYWGKTGEEIRGCRMAEDLSGVVPGTLKQLTACRDGEGGVNEGPFMLRYQGKYYLTYSVNGYTDHDYSVRLAVSDSPLGDYADRGIILQKCGPIVGTGHHSFTTSPDGDELIIAYHCHYSPTQIHARRLCIDRCRFVETEDGFTISVYGPTSTPQPYPGN